MTYENLLFENFIIITVLSKMAYDEWCYVMMKDVWLMEYISGIFLELEKSCPGL